ncbi:hypothetical protein [Micromonospora sp. NPDC004704]
MTYLIATVLAGAALIPGARILADIRRTSEQTPEHTGADESYADVLHNLADVPARDITATGRHRAPGIDLGYLESYQTWSDQQQAVDPDRLAAELYADWRAAWRRQQAATTDTALMPAVTDEVTR